MKIIIEEIGDHIAISFTGKGKKSTSVWMSWHMVSPCTSP